MEAMKQKCKRMWGRCRRCHVSYNIFSSTKKRRRGGGAAVAPEGCLWVEVGPTRERFVMRVELANHPTFKTLLNDVAESEYGFAGANRGGGPIWLPDCDADSFGRALAGMETETETMEEDSSSWGCRFRLYAKSCPNSAQMQLFTAKIVDLMNQHKLFASQRGGAGATTMAVPLPFAKFYQKTKKKKMEG
ncbi:auxin-responsive protein SAUR71-like [Senna tora]|uniref:Auxin-responsive protein SAUR71-like n=2 Tax=Senna tora TaxID=362788 RepID=A0A834X529_9FABA|nr:auxin-responsive protein SAUR71-like [Senna tora]